MTPGPLLLLAAASLTAGIIFGPRYARGWLIVSLVGAIAVLAAAVVVLAGGFAWEWRSEFCIGGEFLHLRLDALSAVFVALLGVGGGTGAAYANGYWTDRQHPRSAPRGRRWWSAAILSQLIVMLSLNGLHFLIGWELFALSAYFLITLNRHRRAVRQAGWLYLGASHVGTLALFAFFGTLAARTGSWELGPMRAATELAPLFWLGLVGFGLKAGMFPLHIRLPSAHASAPSHVSALLSGVSLKLGIYGLVRFTGWLPVPATAPWIVIGFGAVTAVLGIAFSLAQNDLKRLLAYCSVENIGIILIGLGTAMLGVTHGDAPWGRLALAGTLLHVWNHGLFKSLLFYGAGSVLHATGTREMSRLGGLWRAMPWTTALFALGAAAISGLPPLNGFVSEWSVYLGLFDAVTGRSSAAWAAMPAAIALATTGALALAAFTKASAITFLGSPRTREAARAHESGSWMLGPMFVLAGLCVLIGLAPAFLWPAVARATGVWHASWMDVAVPAPLSALGPVQWLIAVAATVAIAGLGWRIRQNGPRRGLTWDGGYSAPTVHLQYTAGSFAGIAAGWFAWILQPTRRWQRPRGMLPPAALWLERTPETVLERLLEPIARLILRVSLAARRLQHGRLQYYVAYVVAGLAALGTFVALGTLP